MLASGTKEEKLKDIWGNWRWICEEKVGGSRYVLQFDSDGNPCLTSRCISVKTNKPVEKTENLLGYVCTTRLDLAGTILDGEIVGGDSFPETVKLMGSSPKKAKELLKNGYRVRYIVYDILEHNGVDVRDRPLHFRKKILKELIKGLNNPYIELVKEVDNHIQSFNEIVAEGGEGVILKYKNSTYSEGCRSKDWVKVKKVITEEGIIMGMKEGTGKYKGNLGR